MLQLRKGACSKAWTSLERPALNRMRFKNTANIKLGGAFSNKFHGKTPSLPAKQALQFGPLEAFSRVCFSPWRYMFMPGYVVNWMALCNSSAQACKCFILGTFKRVALQALKFNADRVVVAVFTSPVLRCARMPGALIGSNKLPKLAVALNVEMGRNLHAFDVAEIGVR